MKPPLIAAHLILVKPDFAFGFFKGAFNGSSFWKGQEMKIGTQLARAKPNHCKSLKYKGRNWSAWLGDVRTFFLLPNPFIPKMKRLLA